MPILPALGVEHLKLFLDFFFRYGIMCMNQERERMMKNGEGYEEYCG